MSIDRGRIEQVLFVIRDLTEQGRKQLTPADVAEQLRSDNSPIPVWQLRADFSQLAVEAQPSSTHLDTLAAAYAETGQFDRAVETQREAIAALLAADMGEQEGLERRLQAYQRAQPWRE